MNKIAIVIGTYNRGNLLRRSLTAYAKHKGLSVVIIDDGSDDNTLDVVKEFESSGLDLHYNYLGDKQGYRDSASFLNKGISFALYELNASHVFVTHPEIIVGATTIQSAVNDAIDSTNWISCKGYYLTPEQQAVIDSVDWQSDLLNVRQLPDFYAAPSAEFTGNKDYLPAGVESILVWDSWIFGGGSRDMWLYFGGLTEFETWGSVDVDLLMRRTIAEIKTITPNESSDYVVHQNHDAPRDMDKCMAALKTYVVKEEALKPHLLYKYE